MTSNSSLNGFNCLFSVLIFNFRHLQINKQADKRFPKICSLSSYSKHSDGKQLISKRGWNRYQFCLSVKRVLFGNGCTIGVKFYDNGKYEIRMHIINNLICFEFYENSFEIDCKGIEWSIKRYSHEGRRDSLLQNTLESQLYY